jgi:GT2 family glycosyltransferase
MPEMPRISVITVVVDEPRRVLERCAKSVVAQTVADWEWIVVCDRTLPRGMAELMRDLRARFPQIRLLVREQATASVALRNAGIEAATGEWLVFLGARDELEEEAVERVAEVADADPEVDFIYSDEIVLDRTASMYRRVYKPAWSPDRLRCQHYTGDLAAMRRELVHEVGGLREGFGGVEDHDLALRVSERARSVRHITAALYRRTFPATAVFDETRARAVLEHCERIGLPISDVEPGEVPGTVTVRRAVVGNPKVSIIIPSFGPTAEVRGEERSLLESIVADLVYRTSFENLEILVVPDPDSPEDVMARVAALDPERVRVLPPVPRPFNYSVKVNVGAANATGEFLLFLNDDTEVTHPDWLQPMVAIAQQQDVGMVGAYLRFENDSIQHAGVFLHGGPGHIGFRQMPEDFEDKALLAVDRECITITGACMLMPSSVYDELGGHTLILPSNWDDVDLGLKVVTSGRRVVWTPHARLYHFESMSRDPWVQYFELLRFWGRWAAEVLADPFFTPPIGPSSYSWPATRFR